MENKALGIIEVIGLTLAIEVLDCALKSANVNFLGMEKVGSGIITVMITGDVAAVTAATEAASIAGEKLGTIRSANVIARPVADVYKMFDAKKSIEKTKITPKANNSDIKLIDNNSKISAIKLKENTEKSRDASSKDSTRLVNAKEIKPKNNTDIALEKMSVSDLRKLARELKLTNIAKPEIKFAKRKQLIEKIIEFRKDN